jgi:riboflavin kinase/FMN adenylyltransferase
VIVARQKSELEGLSGPLAVSVGVFDGMHRGHQAVFEMLGRCAERTGASQLVVSLDPHPLEVLRPETAPPLLTTPPERARLLRRFAPDGVLFYPFDRETAALSPTEFLGRLLPLGSKLTVLVVGYDFRMGKDRSGGFEELRAAGESQGFLVERVEPTLVRGEPVSSSRIRHLVAEGRVREAEELLGHRYVLEGEVVPGRGIGRTLDFPTANVDVGDTRKLLPGFGVYAVLVQILDRDGEGSRGGVMNLGVRPTFGESDPVMEVHLPGFQGELTGSRLVVELVERIREEQTFDGPRALAARIEADVEEARRILGNS